MFARALLLSLAIAAPLAAKPPNVVLVITDDQGYGDLGVNGNPKIRTPNIDKFAKQSVRLTNFYVCPVCSPTRSSLMTGRYNYRTGVVDTYLGRSLMYPDEVTIAEVLRDHGYRTGIFGKWHLGDTYPLRAIDQGFQEALICKGGGLTQPSDPPGNTYFDPILMHNGKAEKTRGYCTDVFTDAALKFIEQNADKPFFAYVAFNAPHDPLQVDQKLVEPYLKMDLSPDQFPKVGQPVIAPAAKETTARVYAMIENIDTNFGRLLKLLDQKKLAGDTIVIFMCDNGPAQSRWNSGLRGRKGSVFEGGIRVPFFIRWPAKLAPRDVATGAAHIDILPTLLSACGLAPSTNIRIDGRNLMSLLSGSDEKLPDRWLFFQWHRGDVPERNRSFAVRGPRYKLVQPFGAGERERDQWELMLFDLVNDPYEQHNIAAENAERVRAIQREYGAWFDDVGKPRGYDPPRIHLGSDAENPVSLTRQDWRGPRAGWRTDDLGYWQIHVERDAMFTITCRFAPRTDVGVVRLRIGGLTREQPLPAKATEVIFRGVTLPKGDARLETWLEVGAIAAGANYVDVERK
jgi:arylsulfatase A-like enzyme